MNLKTIGFVVGGFAAGAATATAVFYFGIYKRYIPLKDLEQEIADLERKKYELNQQFKDNHEKFVNVKRSTDEAIRRKEQELDFYDDQIIEVKKEWEAVKAAKTYGDPKVTEQKDISDDPDDERGDEFDDDPVDIDSDEPDRDNFIIDDGVPRWDGPLTDDEQRQYDEANGDERIEQSILMTIKARRWHQSIDDDEPSYQISEEDHENAPWFIDTENLDYWEDDDVLARGMEIVQDPDAIINTIVLNRFGRLSQSGDPNVVWCRNDILETDYEITRHDGSYQHEVLGIPEEESYRPKKRFNSTIAAEMEEVNDQ